MKNEIIPYKSESINKEILDDFNEETIRVKALDFYEFLNENKYNNKSIIGALFYLQDFVDYVPTTKISKGINHKLNIDLILEFYDSLGLKNKVEKIVLNKHPMFNTSISKEHNSSYVSHTYKDNKISVQINNFGSFYGVLEFVHECAHAISGYYNFIQNMIKERNKLVGVAKNSSKEVIDYKYKTKKFFNTQEKFDVDCISEIQTHIIELLFVDFLLEKNSISPEDKQSFLQKYNNNVRQDMTLIFEEFEIYSTLAKIKEENNNFDYETTEQEFKKLIKELKNMPCSEYNLKRVSYIRKRKNNPTKNNWHSSFRLRYVIGKIVSEVWMNDYYSSNKQQKNKMIQTLKKFISTNHTHNLDSSIDMLLNGRNFEDLIADYATIKQHQNKNL